MSAPARTLPAAATLWFPFFFAAAFSLMFLLAFAAPQPHGMRIALVGAPAQTAPLAESILSLTPRGFDVATETTGAQPEVALARDEIAAVYRLDADGSGLLSLGSAASPTRAEFLQRYFTDILPDHTGVQAPKVVDVVPAAAGDVSGVGLFFYALPLLLVGMITSTVLLQFPGWETRRRVLTQAATGVFATVFAFVAAVWLDVIPPALWLLPLGILLTQAIGWLTTAVAMLAKHFFMPIVMTFVLILNIPSSGGTVNQDMMPPLIAALHQILPFGQFVDVARSVIYFGAAGAAVPTLGLIVWAAAGAALLTFAHRRARVGAEKSRRAISPPAAASVDTRAPATI